MCVPFRPVPAPQFSRLSLSSRVAAQWYVDIPTTQEEPEKCLHEG